MSTNVRPYFRGETACRVGALEVHKLKKNDIRKRYAIFLRFFDKSIYREAEAALTSCSFLRR